MAILIKLRQTFQIDGELNPLVVDATVIAEREDGSWNWSVDEIHLVEIQFGLGARSLVITEQVKSSPSILAIITSQVADQEDKIYEALANQKTAA